MRYPFVVGHAVQQYLGERALADIARNVWLADCQLCGEPLEDKASLVFDDLGAFGSAALYHRTCRSSEVRTDQMVSDGLAFLTRETDEALLSYNFISSLVAAKLDDGTESRLPLVMINPSLEQVVLRRDDTGAWFCATVQHYEDLGLTGINTKVPVEGAHAAFTERDGSVLRVWIGLTGQHWEIPIDLSTDMLTRILECRGVAVAVTTAYLPVRLIADSVDDFIDALKSDDVAMGWIALTGQ